MTRDPARLVIALILLAAACDSCSVGMQPSPPPAPKFCEVGHLILPGGYMGRVGIVVRGETIVRPLLAGDSVCLRVVPDPWDSLEARPDSTKPTVLEEWLRGV